MAVLSGDKILLAQKQFDPITSNAIQEKIKQLGATVVEERQDATILLVNPASLAYAQEVEHDRFLGENYPAVARPALRPHHWLAACLYTPDSGVDVGDSQKEVKPSNGKPRLEGDATGSTQPGLMDNGDLDPVKPYLVHPSETEDHRPLLIWVSKNVERHGQETQEEATQNVIKQVELAGAISVNKRAHADVLIVDKQSHFFKTVREEKERHNRTWQKLAERDWVDWCRKNGKLMWEKKEIEDEEETTAAAAEGVSAQDSFVEEEPRPAGSGPGRPAGKPRIEYSPEDDDFLCRYLAAHHPGGSWQSRKTYNLLLDKVYHYPIASRHTSQSWHERFKKNQAAFGRRVQRYIQSQIDDTLKTSDERAETERRRLEEEGDVSANIEDDSISDSFLPTQAGPSRSTLDERKPEIHDGQRKAPLVSLEDGDDDEGSRVPDGQADTSADGALQTEGSSAVGLQQTEATVLEENAVTAEELVIEKNDTAADLLPSTQDLVEDSHTTAELEITATTATTASPLPVEASLLESAFSQPSQSDSGPSQEYPSTIRGQETQAVLADFAVMQARASAAAAANSGSTSRRAVHTDEENITQTSPRQAVGLPQLSPNANLLSPVRPASELIGLRNTPLGHAQQALRGLIDHITPISNLARNLARLTPSPGGLRTPLRDELERKRRDRSSEGGSNTKRRRTLEPLRGQGGQGQLSSDSAPIKQGHGPSSGSRNKRRASPDRVYTSVTVPPPAERPTSHDQAQVQQRSPTSAPKSTAPRGEAPLTPQEYHERIEAGRSATQKAAQEYRLRIGALQDKYGVGKEALMQTLKDIRKESGSGAVGWEKLERKLSEKYGF